MLLLLGVACAFTVVQFWTVIGPGAVGGDFEPLRAAASSLLHGRSVYSDPWFVYPPTAAIALVPTAFGSPSVAYGWWTCAGIGALLTAAVLIGRTARRGARVAAACVAVLALVDGCVATDAEAVGNLTFFLVPLAIGVVIAWERGRWTLGCAVLAVSLLLKPLLLPLLAVPVLRRRWAELAKAMGPAALVLGLATVLVPGGSGFARVLRYCLSGTNLHGGNAVHNLSIRGWFEAHGESTAVGLTIAGVIAAAGLFAVAVPLLRREVVPPARLANTVLVTVLLAGSISEVHFLLVVIGLILLELAARPSVRAVALTAPGLIMLALPSGLVDQVAADAPARQSWYLVAELAVFIAAVAPAFSTLRLVERAPGPKSPAIA